MIRSKLATVHGTVRASSRHYSTKFNMYSSISHLTESMSPMSRVYLILRETVLNALRQICFPENTFINPAHRCRIISRLRLRGPSLRCFVILDGLVFMCKVKFLKRTVCPIELNCYSRAQGRLGTVISSRNSKFRDLPLEYSNLGIFE